MGNCLYARDACCGYDMDVLLAYPTPKIVLLKDRLLGFCNRLFCCAIIIYVVLILIWMNQTYKEYLPPTGTVDLSIQTPQNFTNSTLSYCASDVNPPVFHSVIPCALIDENVAFSFSTNQFNILTRVSRKFVEWADYKKRIVNEAPLESIFAERIEEYTLKVDHQWEVTKFKMSDDLDAEGTNYDMEGSLIDAKGNVLQTFGHGSDIFSVGTLLQAADVKLDDLTSNVEASEFETKRYSGIAMIFEIQYIQNRAGDVRYEYRVSQIKGAEHKRIKLVAWNETHEIRESRHSISITFIPAGQIGRFSFYNLLLVIVSSYSLLLVSNTITETLMLYILPLSEHYYNLKYEESIDFSVYRAERNLDMFGVRNSASCCNRLFPCFAGQPKTEGLLDTQKPSVTSVNNSPDRNNVNDPTSNSEILVDTSD